MSESEATDIAALRALMEKATPAPWDGDYIYAAVRHISRNVESDTIGYEGPFDGWDRYSDAQFITAIVNSAPAMLSEIERLRASETAAAASARDREIALHGALNVVLGFVEGFARGDARLVHWLPDSPTPHPYAERARKALSPQRAAGSEARHPVETTFDDGDMDDTAYREPAR